MSCLPRAVWDLDPAQVLELPFRIRGVFTRQGIERLGQLACLSDAQLLWLPNFSTQSLHDLCEALENLRQRISGFSPDQLSGLASLQQALYMGSSIKAFLAFVLRGITPAEHEVMARRVLGHPPATLEQLGTRLGVTRERVRQLEVRLLSRFGRFRPVGAAIDERLGRARREGEPALTVRALELRDPWFRGCGAHPRMLAVVLRELGCSHAVNLMEPASIALRRSPSGPGDQAGRREY